ncbi:MAG: dipeptidase [Ignavibacteria bacterium]
MKLKFLILLVFLSVARVSQPCTNFLISKGATIDGSTMITYSADSHTLYGELYYFPSTNYPDGSYVDVYDWDTGKLIGRIRQVTHTFSVVGNMNEYQVSIGETTFGGREELRDTTALIDYGSLMYITLQRAKTAREAIQIMAQLVEEYGYYSEGESFSIADPNEVWILEMIGKGVGNKGAVWVARKIPDGFICGHANQARISTFPLNDPENCLYSKDVISFARSKGYFQGKDEEFSFCDAYAPITFDAARFCEARVWSGFNKVTKGMEKYLDYAMGKNLKNRMPLWVKPDRKLSVEDVMEIMRDHFEGTPMDMTKDPGAGPYACPYRWRPLTWKIDKDSKITYFNERAISTQQTGFSFVAQSRHWLPNHIGGILWFGVDDTYSTVYVPMYCGITEVPSSFAEGNGSMMEFSDSSAFWIFNQVSNFAYTRYKDIIPEIRTVQKNLEHSFIDSVKIIDDRALDTYNNGQENYRDILTSFSVSSGNFTFHIWKELYKYLFTKYMDGNIKTKIPGQKNPKVNQPGYSQEFYKLIVKETGDKFKVLGEESH